MGVLNCTPDSFSDGGQFYDRDVAIDHAHQMIADGVDIIDVGGESTRPGSDPVDPDEQIERTMPVIEAIRRVWPGPISIDTTQSSVAKAALDAGANWINDVTALRDDPQMVILAAARHTALVLMHMLGTPRTMQESPQYRDVVREVTDFLTERAAYAESQGVPKDRIVIDPGIGFGKTIDHNLELLRHCRDLANHGYRLLIGASRKSFIGKITGMPVDTRLDGSVAVAVWSALRGASIVRVHDVAETRRALDVVGAIAGEHS
ncbi:MAG: dihydropteroate synthase [candidate division Zixibacteria bacterium]|nr:dihydropteroate synthase [candidate division Zixibacteria bacterium]